MHVKSFLTRSVFLACALIVLVVVFPSGDLNARQPSPQEKSRIEEQTAFNAKQPVKMSLKVLAKELKVGTKAQMQITTLNAKDEPVPIPSDWQCELSLVPLSGSSTTQLVWIRTGESTVQVEILPEKAGLTTINLRPLNIRGVRPDKTVVIVQPAKQSPKNKVPRGSSSLIPHSDFPHFLTSARYAGSVRLRMASFKSEQQTPSSNNGPESGLQTANGSPFLYIFVNDVDDPYFANGTDGPTISVAYVSSDSTPAPADIRVWFKLTRGSLAPPQPLLIAKGSATGTTHLTSLWPGDVNVTFDSSSPIVKEQGQSSFEIHFIPATAVLKGPTELSVVDKVPVSLVFYDAQKNPVSAEKIWHVTLHSKNSKLHFAPDSFDVQPTLPQGSTMLLADSIGEDEIDVVVEHYQPLPLDVTIKYWSVLGLCLAGGVAGGLAAFNKLKGSWLWRIFLGIVGGLFLSWVYVYLALPSISADVAHNMISVFFIAVLGGYMGTATLDFAAKKFGLIS